MKLFMTCVKTLNQRYVLSRWKHLVFANPERYSLTRNDIHSNISLDSNLWVPDRP